MVKDHLEQEIRFAVVLYGGVSLAIYINGVTQELLRMVRATAPLAADGAGLSGTELIYRQIARYVGPSRNPGEPIPLSPAENVAPEQPIRSRFVIDIISGTSAGGINGVALAKALALRCRSMEVLRNTWLSNAQLDQLLNDDRRKLFQHKSSLLDSEHMYEMVYKTLSRMNAEDKGSDKDGPFADQIDLFVTATDLNGREEPLQLADMQVNERVHKTVFRFSYVSPDASQELALGSPVNEFAACFDPMLAFAARCTSSFPVAFEPMCFKKIEPVLRKEGKKLEDAERDFAAFFKDFTARGLGFGTGALALEDRPFADGGYLDNRPFSYAIDLIQYRASARPVQRKLLFVDPFPEYAADHPVKAKINFFENATLALTTLPRYQTIRSDIDRIHNSNRRQDRLATLHADLDENPIENKLSTPEGFDKKYPDELVKQHNYPPSYIPYHHQRVQATTADLADLYRSVAGFRAGGDEEYFITLLIRAWRRARYSSFQCGEKVSESSFLSTYDLDYRRRRLNHVINRIDLLLERKVTPEQRFLNDTVPERIHDLRSMLVQQLGRLNQARNRLANPGPKNPLLDPTLDLMGQLGGAFEDILRHRQRDARYKAAEKVCETHKLAFDKLMTLIAQHYGETLSANSAEIAARLAAAPDYSDAREAYENFQWHDALTLPFLDGTDAKEHTIIEVYRVGPADGSLLPSDVLQSRPDRKLAGTAAGDFGGFLQRSWRENDMMWGRLDGAERIIGALLPDPGDEVVRHSLITRAQDAILAEELSPTRQGVVFRWMAESLRRQMGTDVSVDALLRRGKELYPQVASAIAGNDFRKFVETHYRKPDPPGPQDILIWTNRALRIFSHMLSDMDDETSGVALRLSRPIRWAGMIAAQLAIFGVPQRFGWVLLGRWLGLVALAAALLLVAGLVFHVQNVSIVGYGVLLACLIGWGMRTAFGDVMRQRPGAFPRLAYMVLGLVALLLLVDGAYDLYAQLIKTFF
jgi:patatin-related protein